MSTRPEPLCPRRKQKGDPVKNLRAGLAWSAFAGLVHAFMLRADEEALADGQRLLRLYPDEAASEYKQAALIVADLKRRQDGGAFGKAPTDKAPEGYEAWPAARKVTYLIAALDEVDVRQNSQPGGVDLATDRRVDALIRFGDGRRCRPCSMRSKATNGSRCFGPLLWRDFSRIRTVIQGVRRGGTSPPSCRSCAQVFHPAGTGDNFTGRGEEAAKSTAKRLRDHWKTYGQFPFDERMMKTSPIRGRNSSSVGRAIRN